MLPDSLAGFGKEGKGVDGEEREEEKERGKEEEGEEKEGKGGKEKEREGGGEREGRKGNIFGPSLNSFLCAPLVVVMVVEVDVVIDLRRYRY